MAARKILALSPTPECLCLAARCERAYELRTSGKEAIEDVLDELIAGEPPAELLVIHQVDIQDAEAVRPRLSRLLKRGTRVTWLLREHQPQAAALLDGEPRVKVVRGASPTAAFDAAWPKQGPVHDFSQRELNLYLSYKVSIHFMCSRRDAMNMASLEDAIRRLRGIPSGQFSLGRLPAAEAQSVRQYEEFEAPYIEGLSEPMQQLKQALQEVGPTRLSVLLIGETGTGKESAAYYLHTFSARMGKPLVCINCAGLDEMFLRSELFGHVKGAFTGAITARKGLVEKASGGTLFLDELSDMPASVQADLLRFLQTRKYLPLGSDQEKTSDVRLIAATQPSLMEKLRTGEFRIDLYYRLAGVELRLPSLAELPEDILRMVRNIVYRSGTQLLAGQPEGEIARRMAETLAYFREHAELLKQRPWPGNVRELVQLVRRRLCLGQDVLHEPTLVSGLGAAGAPSGANAVCALLDGCVAPPLTVDALAARYVAAARRRFGDVAQKDLAQQLGISVNTLKKYVRASNVG